MGDGGIKQEGEAMTSPTVTKVARSVTLLVVSRVSMALAIPLVTLITYLGSGWLESKFDMMNSRVDGVEKVAVVASDTAIKVNDRLTAVETKQTNESATSEKFQNATLNRLDRMQDSLVGLSNAVSALTATLQAVVEDNRQRNPKR